MEIIICNKLAVFIETMRLKYTHNVQSQRKFALAAIAGADREYSRFWHLRLSLSGVVCLCVIGSERGAYPYGQATH